MEQLEDSTCPAKEGAAVSRQSAISPFQSEMKMEFDRRRQLNKCYFKSVLQLSP